MMTNGMMWRGVYSILSDFVEHIFKNICSIFNTRYLIIFLILYVILGRIVYGKGISCSAYL